MAENNSKSGADRKLEQVVLDYGPLSKEALIGEGKSISVETPKGISVSRELMLVGLGETDQHRGSK